MTGEKVSIKILVSIDIIISRSFLVPFILKAVQYGGHL